MNTFSALADPTRFHIVEMLATKGRLPVSQISKRFPVSAPAISQHLKVLKEAKLVRVDVQAQQRIYSLNPVALDEIDAWTRRMRQFWNDRFDTLEALLKDDNDTKPTKPKKRK